MCSMRRVSYSLRCGRRSRTSSRPGGGDHRDRGVRRQGRRKPLDDRHKRELTAREREGIAEVLNVAESWLRDCLAISQGVADLAVNRDALTPWKRSVRSSLRRPQLAALDAVRGLDGASRIM